MLKYNIKGYINNNQLIICKEKLYLYTNICYINNLLLYANIS